MQKTDEALPLKASDDELDEGEVETGGKAREAAEAGGQPEPSVRVYKGETTTTTVTLVHIRNSSSERSAFCPKPPPLRFQTFPLFSRSLPVRSALH